jgi:hypothetical protein
MPRQSSKARALAKASKGAPAKTRDRLLTDIVSQGMASNASTAMRFVRADFGDLALTDMLASLREQCDAIDDGDLSGAERMLHGQAVALNAIFGELARRAAMNMNDHLTATEVYMKLALKAQGQCRMTWETLATIKNPPLVIARQANINNGQMQVNYRAAEPTTAPRAPEMQSVPNELLEDLTHERTELDTRATPATGREDTSLDPVVALNRPAKF